MPVLISSELTGPLPVSIDYLRVCGERLLRLCGREKGELSILLVSDSRIKELNGKYREKQKPTNVLSFAMQEGLETRDYDLLGDIVISVETAAREARLENISIHRRITVLLIHGLLHLLGLDHERSGKEAAAMRKEEEILLNHAWLSLFVC